MASFDHLYHLEARSGSVIAVVLRYGTTIATAVATFLLAYDSGSYDEASRDSLAIAVWWTVTLALALGIWPLARPPVAAFVTGSLLAALALFTLLSTAWAPSAEKAFAEFNRVALYFGVFLLAVVAARRANAGSWSNGMAIGITAVALVSLASRFFPDLFGDRDVTSFLPSSLNRLSFPVDYWNGLAILLALGIPLLLRAAIVERSHVARGLAVTALPAVVAALYLTSSRGGVAAAVLATVAFFAMTSARWAAGGAIGLAALGGAAAVGVLLDRHELVNGPFDSPLAASQGESAAVLLTVICLLTGIAYGIASRVVAEVSPPRPAVGRAVLLVLAVVALAGIVRLDPVSRVEAFKEPPRVLRGAGGEDRIRAHLASASGNGRWQLWSAAVDEFKAEPVHGGGAGSYEAWWTEHGTLSVFVRDAHALYPEVLGELGIVGFVLLLGTFGSALVAVVLRLRRLNGSLLAPGGERTEERATLAAFAASFVGFVVAAGVDWVWELTVVSVVAMVCLGLITGPATDVVPRPRLVRGRESSRRAPRSLFGLGTVVLVVGWLLVCTHALPLFSDLKIRDSQAAVADGDAERALDDALAARSLEPWAASPYLQVALVSEAAGSLEPASKWIDEAIERDRSDWRLWLVASRIQAKLGRTKRARASLARVRELNPRSLLFARYRREPRLGNGPGVSTTIRP